MLKQHEANKHAKDTFRQAGKVFPLGPKILLLTLHNGTSRFANQKRKVQQVRPTHSGRTLAPSLPPTARRLRFL